MESNNASKNPRQEEIESLHRFFVKWFKGEIPQTKDLFQKHFAETLSQQSPSMVLISPGGKRTEYNDLIHDLYNLYGCRTKDPTYDIWIERVKEDSLGNGFWLMEYEEHQRVNKEHTKRLSTALLRERDEGGLEWVRVHETWMPSSS